jgi:uncharacterized membrane protein
VACVVLLVVTLGEAAAAYLFSGYFAMASDACFSADCDTTPITVGILVAQGGTLLLWLGALLLSFRAWGRDRLSFYWPLLAALAIPAVFALGGAIASTTGQ